MWGMYQSWKYGLHIALFSYVGQTKMADMWLQDVYDTADFHSLHRAELEERQRQRLRSEGRSAGLSEGHSDIIDAPCPPRWEGVTHFVILPNYQEDLEILRLAANSIAASKIATEQIVLVMAMELREEGSVAKAELLRLEFEASFLAFVATFHPPGLEGETPGKSSNTRWAANQVFESEIPRLQVDMENVILTVADADSEFHCEYYPALNPVPQPPRR